MSSEIVVGLERLEPMDVVPVAALHPALVYLASLAPDSVVAMRSALNQSARLLSAETCDYETLPWHLLRAPHLRALRSWLVENRSASTANKVLSAVRATLKVAWELNLIDTDSYHRAVAVKGAKAVKPEQATGRMLTAGEVHLLITPCVMDKTIMGVRDALIIILGLYGGMRGIEIVRMQVEHYERDRQRLRIEGKGHKERVLPLEQGMVWVIEDWLHVRGEHPGPLVNRVLKSGQRLEDGLSVDAVHDVVKKRGKKSGLKKFTPHDMRRTFISGLLDAGADLSIVQQLAGHSNASITASYDRRPERARRAAMNLRGVDYERRYDS